jgi:hypothetical protein
MRKLIAGYRITQAVHVAAVLGISDLLVDGPRSVGDLAAAVDADAASLGRLLRALAAEGVYAEDERGWFANTDLGDALRRDVPGSLKMFAAVVGQAPHWRAWGHLLHSIRTGENAFRDLYGTDVWTARRRESDDGAVFDAWMAANTETIAGAVVSAYDFAGAKTVVDVAGGTGALLGAVLEANPDLSGVLFEQPVVIDRAAELVGHRPWADRCRLVGGSMFDTVPSGGDVYLMKSIVHDWTDTEAVQILVRCRDAMPESAVLLVIERLLEGPNLGADTKFSDLNMLVLPGGRERSEVEFAELCEQAGLRLRRTIRTESPWWILEAVRS